MAYAIRPFSDADAPALAQITVAAIRAVGKVGYSNQQVEAWAARHPGPERFIARAAQGEAIFVAVNAQSQPVAYALLGMKGDERGHLDMLYCHPDHTRKGLADELLAQAEHHARGHAFDCLFTEASELARPAFERAGYAVTHCRDFEIDHGGTPVAIHNYAMEKPLI